MADKYAQLQEDLHQAGIELLLGNTKQEDRQSMTCFHAREELFAISWERMVLLAAFLHENRDSRISDCQIDISNYYERQAHGG